MALRRPALARSPRHIAPRTAKRQVWSLFAFAFWLTALLIAGPVAAATAILEDGETRALGRYLVYVEDPSGELALEDIMLLPGTRWQRSQTDTPAFGITRTVYWFRLEVRNPEQFPVERVLEIGTPLLWAIDAWIAADDGPLTHFRLGNQTPIADRTIKHRLNLAPLSLNPTGHAQIYLRVQSKRPMHMPVNLWEKDEILARGDWSALFFGAMLAMIAYVLCIALAMRNRSYLYLALFSASVTLLIASIEGYSYQYIWPGRIRWNESAALALTHLAIVFHCLYSIRFLNLRQASRGFYRFFFGVALAATVTGSVALAFPATFEMRLSLALVAVLCLGALAAGPTLAMRRIPRARLYTLAWLIFLVAALVLLANRLGFVPRNGFTENPLRIGALVQIFVLAAYALMTDLRILNQAHEQAQVLASVDPLTGLPNRRLFEQRLETAIALARERQSMLGVLFIDLNRFKHINDRHGLAAGDQLLREVANRLKSVLRAGDAPARIGGDEFTLVVENIAHIGALAVVARKIATGFREAFEVDGHNVQVTPSIGISVFPHDAEDAQTLLDLADQAMYRGKRADEPLVWVTRPSERVSRWKPRKAS